MSTPDNRDMLAKMRHGRGFIAALDQSGGSTPKALQLYGIDQSQYRDDAEMFDAVHAMRSRIVTSASFNGERILGAILFENTLEREFAGLASAQFLWQEKGIVPFLKVDQGLAEAAAGVQLMKPMPALDNLLDKGLAHGVFGTKMRSVIKAADASGIEQLVEQQFAIGKRILGRGLVPIIEPEVDIHAPDKGAAEQLLRQQLRRQLDSLDGQQVMLKLTLPEVADFYSECIVHPQVLKVVALSGGYSRLEANRRVGDNPGMVASFSRALTEGLQAQQSAADFDAALDDSIASIYRASCT